jgi:hypothetical protein
MNSYTEHIALLLAFGANVVVKPPVLEDALRLAVAAKKGGGLLTFVGSFQWETARQIAEVGGKHVAFDLARS